MSHHGPKRLNNRLNVSGRLKGVSLKSMGNWSQRAHCGCSYKLGSYKKKRVVNCPGDLGDLGDKSEKKKHTRIAHIPQSP